MSQFDDLRAVEQKLSNMPGTGMGTSGLTYPPQPMPPREMNLTERVMTHDQRILELEKANNEMRQAVERLSQLLVEQLGLQIR